VDFAGIIFYGSYVRFFEIAETELFRACGLAYAQVFDRYNIFLPRKAVHSEFYSPARLDDRLRVATYIGRVGTKSMTLNFDVLRDDAPGAACRPRRPAGRAPDPRGGPGRARRARRARARGPRCRLSRPVRAVGAGACVGHPPTQGHGALRDAGARAAL
jgi:YbgC/YbaW family acyl-CoA thioester hydrolase